MERERMTPRGGPLAPLAPPTGRPPARLLLLTAAVASPSLLLRASAGEYTPDGPSYPVSAPSCTLKCGRGGPCQFGPADYGPVADFPYESPVDFIEVTEIEGMHCLCPEGRAGVRCEHRYRVCDDLGPERGVFACFHGSDCVDLGSGDAPMWACDCSGATWKGRSADDGVHFAGRHCEHRSTDVCRMEWVCDRAGLNCYWRDNGSERGGWFCVNGGECNYDDENPNDRCRCPDGWTGPRCEYVYEPEAAIVDRFEADMRCSLGCANGGVCAFGDKDYSDEIGTNTSGAGMVVPFLGEAHRDGMHCLCPEGWTGVTCEVGVARCGDMLNCYNGAECREEAATEDGTVVRYCDCGPAGGGGDEEQFVGVGCQHSSGGAELCPEFDVYCVNGGSCADEGDGHMGCVCPRGYSGQHCEYHESEPSPSELYNLDRCTLRCANGGECVKDVDEIRTAGPLSLSETTQEEQEPNRRSFERCSCPPEYGGPDCSYRREVCGEGRHVCMHGGKCYAHSVDGGGGAWEWRCDCAGAYDADHEAVAGMFCQHPAGKYCVRNGNFATSWHAFCTNGGTCRAEIEPNQEHPGCLCKEGWAGDFCEYQQKDAPAAATTSKWEDGRTRRVAAILLSGFILAVAVAAFGAAYVVVRFRRRDKDTCTGEDYPLRRGQDSAWKREEDDAALKKQPPQGMFNPGAAAGAGDAEDGALTDVELI